MSRTCLYAILFLAACRGGATGTQADEDGGDDAARAPDGDVAVSGDGGDGGISPDGAVTAPGHFVSPSGEDANPGNTVDHPFRTVQRCATVAQAGDVCFLRAG